jgi:hypothetical protein
MFLFSSFWSNAQFDHVVVNPVGRNPSLVGSLGKKRINLYLSQLLDNYDYNNLSYDFFSNRLKGGWGINVFQRWSNRIINESGFGIAYSPKLTFGNNDLTWSPAISISHTFANPEQLHLLTYNSKNFPKYSFETKISLMRNTNRTAIGAYISYNPINNNAEYVLDLIGKIKKDPNSKTSSTLYLSPRLVTNKAWIFYNYSYVNSLILSNKTAYFQVAYTVTTGKLLIGIEKDFAIWRQGLNRREDSFYTTNYLSPNGLKSTMISLGYKGKKITLTGKYSFSRYNPIVDGYKSISSSFIF